LPEIKRIHNFYPKLSEDKSLILLMITRKKVREIGREARFSYLIIVDLKKEAALTLMDDKYDKEVDKHFRWAAFESNMSILVQNLNAIIRIEFHFIESQKTAKSQ
jgi:hypothetical protein